MTKRETTYHKSIRLNIIKGARNLKYRESRAQPATTLTSYLRLTQRNYDHLLISMGTNIKFMSSIDL